MREYDIVLVVLRQPGKVRAMQHSRPRVGLLIESSRAYGRGVLQGIGSYAREHGPWSLDIEERLLSDDEPTWISSWEGDGIIARVESRLLEEALRRTATPIVDVRGTHDVDMPVIDTDNRAVATMAASHLIERGFRSFAFCGYGGLNYSELRRDAFCSYVESRGLEVDVYESPARAGARLRDIEQQGLHVEETLAKWLSGLPKPVGVMACNDIRGQQIVKACRELGILIPEEFGLIGVDDDEILCELSDPTLSSVAPDAFRIGYEAAAVLDRMMRTGERTKDRTLIPPTHISARQSTSSPAISDARIAQALCLIRHRATENPSVGEVAQAVSLSRRTFERRFTKCVGRSPKEEILRARLDRVCELLRTTSWSLAEVAERSGFAHSEYMSALFKRKLGETPGQYRARLLDPALASGYAGSRSETD